MKVCWGLREVFKHCFNKDGLFDCLIITNVTRDPIRTMADYVGVKLKRGNVIAGTSSNVPKPFCNLERELWKSFEKEAKTAVLDLPCPLNEEAIQSVYMTLYAWFSFLRVPNQSWDFLKNGVTLWREIQDATKDDDED